MSEIIYFKYPDVREAYERKEPIRFRWPNSAWFDYDYNSMEPPSFECPALIWQVTPKDAPIDEMAAIFKEGLQAIPDARQ